MNLRERWPSLESLCRCAEEYSGLEVWAFGSMLHSEEPRDLDVLIVYRRWEDVAALRDKALWEVMVPEIDIIAMTPSEERHYRFIQVTGARQVHAG